VKHVETATKSPGHVDRVFSRMPIGTTLREGATAPYTIIRKRDGHPPPAPARTANKRVNQALARFAKKIFLFLAMIVF